MRYHIKYRFIKALAVVVSVVAGVSCSEKPEGGLPRQAGEIEGPSEIVEGTNVELKVGKIENADMYRWYHDGRFLKDTDNGVLVADAAGRYSVMGVNGFGEGGMSPEKILAYKADMNIFINRLVGEWDVREYIVVRDEERDQLYSNDHVVTITKIDERTILISNFCYANEDPEDERNGDTVVATVDNEQETIQIPASWKFTPTWYKGLETELCPTISEKFKDNVGQQFPEQHFDEVEIEGKTRLRMTMKTGDIVAVVGDMTMNQTYIVAVTHEGQYQGHFAYYIGTEWTSRNEF